MKKFQCCIEVENLAGGIPNHPKIIRGWAETCLKRAKWDTENIEDVIKTVSERRPALPEDTKSSENVNGFLRAGSWENSLLFENRILGTLLRDAYASFADLRVTGKGKHQTPPFIEVPGLYTPINAPEGSYIAERVSISKGIGGKTASITREETLPVALMSFYVITPDELDSFEDWPSVWTLAENKGLGATRTLGGGRFAVIHWLDVTDDPFHNAHG